MSRRAGVKLPRLRQRPRLLHAPVVYGILREFLGAVQLPSDAASARALWTCPSPIAERIGVACAPVPGAAGLPPVAPAPQAAQGLGLVQAPSPLGGPAALGGNEQQVPARGGAVRAQPGRRGAAAGGAAERSAVPSVDARAPGGAPHIVKWRGLGVATRLLGVVRGRGPWVVDWICACEMTRGLGIKGFHKLN